MSKKIMSKGGGIGESRIFRDENAPDPYAHLYGCHVGGVLVSEMVERMPENWISKLSFEHTDEGFAKRNEGKVESAARVTAGPFEKSCQAKNDFLGNENNIEPWEAPDPLKEVADRHTPEGHRARFLSPGVVRKRGQRGWDVVKVNGEPVKVGEMVLGVMPEAKARQRNAFYAARAAEQIQSEQDGQRQEHERLEREHGGAIGPIRSNKAVQGRFGVGMADPKEEAAYNDDPQAVMGLRTQRGNDRNVTEI